MRPETVRANRRKSTKIAIVLKYLGGLCSTFWNKVLPKYIISVVASGIPLFIFLIMQRIFHDQQRNGIVEITSFFFGVVGAELITILVWKKPSLAFGLFTNLFALVSLSFFLGGFILLYIADFRSYTFLPESVRIIKTFACDFGFLCIFFLNGIETISFMEEGWD